MIALYLSDFILGIDDENHNLSLDNIAYEFEKLFKKLKDIRKNNKHLISEVNIVENHKINGYLLNDIISRIKVIDKDVYSYMLSTLTKPSYIADKQVDTVVYGDIMYQSIVINQCYQNKGILINLILNNNFTNRLPYKDSYITLMHQENYEYVNKYVLLDDTFYLSRIYLDMLNSGYNLLFHTDAYNKLCDTYYINSSSAIEAKIKYILDRNIIRNFDKVNVNYEKNGIGAIKENNPMVRIYFKHDVGNIYFLDVTNDHGNSHINQKIKLAPKKFEEKEKLKDIFEIDDDMYKRKN